VADEAPLFFERRLSLSDCIEWNGARSKAGYGQKRVNGRLEYIHRIAARERFGEIPAGMQVDHLCRNRACYNPDHLEIVTRQENVRRGEAGQHKKALLQRNHCGRGHELTPDNVYITSSGARECRSCKRAWRQQYQQREAGK
jgi:hypothetical protein